ncbi:MAG: phosphoglucosamine mutase [Planctomycetota bacterium]|nr:phosphoglucosamine mutase [Planctomycetota bacterium]MDP6763406.1 phosphoglucosamine mutase [Planctomycetota bacterium]MDP6989697.1 phosphoglucosamine mutase [Planctomycetota bacterium]
MNATENDCGTLFGTDGIRGAVDEGWLRVERVSALGRAIGAVLGRGLDEGAAPGAVLGHDGRRSGPKLEAALASGLASAGLGATSAGLITTPGLAHLTHSGGFALGVMLSASHNPAGDNGIKVLSAAGDKLADETELEIERVLRADLSPEPAGTPPPVDASLQERYLAHLSESAGAGLDLTGLRIAIDCANGAASRLGPRLLEGTGAEVIALFSEPDGLNINEGCGSTHPTALQARVVAEGADLGVALDGDADRCLLVDEAGELVHGDGILTLLARHAVEAGAWPDPRIVATVMSNRGLHRALREVGVEVVTVGVGDRRVSEALRREELPLGGEQSGHIIFGADNRFIGDGLYTALRVLRVLRESGRPLSELASPYRPFPQVLVNVPVAAKPDFSRLPQVEAAVRRIESELADDGRVLLRYSGTEPLARVMVEGPDEDRIGALAAEVAELLGEAIGVAGEAR